MEQKAYRVHSPHLIHTSSVACCLVYGVREEVDKEGKPQPVPTKCPGLLLSGKANSHPAPYFFLLGREEKGGGTR